MKDVEEKQAHVIPSMRDILQSQFKNDDGECSDFIFIYYSFFDTLYIVYVTFVSHAY